MSVPTVAGAEPSSAPHIPESAFGKSETPAQARDPLTGRYIDIHLGASAHPDDAPIDGDRGDSVEPEAPKSQVTEPEAPETPETPESEVTEPEAAKPEAAKDEAAKDSDTQDEVTEEAEEKDRRIPKKRFNEVNEKRKLAERRVVELEKRIEALTKAEDSAYDVAANEKAYMEMVLDGKFDEAVAKREEIDAAKSAKALRAAKIEAVTETKVEVINATLQDISDAATAAFAELDPESDSFNEAIVDQIESFYVGYMGRAKDPLNPVEALSRAIADAVKLHDLDAEPVEDEAPAKKSRPRTTVAEKIAKAKQQPPAVTSKVGRAADDAGVLTDVIDAEQITDKELAKIERDDPVAYARMRGDIL
jgi:hypothetical protein